MAVQTAVDVLARMLDEYDTGDRAVHHVGATTTGGESDALHVDLEVPVPLHADGDGAADRTPCGAALSDDGDLLVQVPTAGIASFPSLPEAEVSTTPTSARVRDGEVLLTLDVTITPTDGAGRAASDTEAPSGDATERDAGHGAVDRDGGAGGTGPNGDKGGTTPALDPDTTNLTGSGASTDPDGGRAVDGDDSQGHRSKGDRGAEAVDDGDGDSDEPSAGSASTGAAGDGTLDPIEAARNDALPPYEDTEYLRALYGRFDTFSEMRDAIEMDVSTETVRRYMIDAGVHDPNSYETTTGRSSPGVDGREAPADSPSDPIPDEHLVTDGIGLPDDLSLEDVLEAVVESSTVYEVTRRLELDQRRTREILEHLDLLDLVMHRVSDDRTREVSYEDVADRLRRVAATP